MAVAGPGDSGCGAYAVRNVARAVLAMNHPATPRLRRPGQDRRRFSSSSGRAYRKAGEDYERAKAAAPAMSVHGRLGWGAAIVAGGVWFEYGLGRALVVFGLLVFGVAVIEIAGIVLAMRSSE